MLRKISLTITLVLITICSFAQNAVIYGIVKDEAGNNIELTTVAIQGTAIGTMTDANGRFRLDVPTDKRYVLAIPESVSYNEYKKPLGDLAANEELTLRITLKSKGHMLTEFEVKKKGEIGSIEIHASDAQKIAGPVGGIEGIIKTYVGTNNELTSQYTVRGGNYDENLVYVNDFEIYRPFLVRSGQQEGLSFVNADLVESVNFSVGGFQSKYGDKMSSVLDVGYKKPKKFGGSVAMSMLGLSMHLEGASKNEKLTYLFGARQKSNQYILQSQPTKGVYNPSFTDIQFLANYQFSRKWEVEVIGNYARNRFNFVPEEQTSSFGLVNQAYQLRVFYTGSEIDQFDSRFGGISTTYRPNKKLKLKLLASGFQTNEQETYDIGGEYLLGELETDLGKESFGQIKTYLGTGVIQTHARNYLNVNVGTVAHRGTYDAGKHFIQWGADAMTTNISDKLHEWERRDSAGFSQPYSPNEVNMRYFYSSSTTFDYSRVSAFLQDNFRFHDSIDLTMSLGVRVNYNFLNGEFITSPRGQLAYRPKWKRDFVFRAAAGLYAQPPFYREMRDLNGVVNKDLKAQKSAHYVLGTEYNFKAFKRPFKITAEAYYKSLWDLVPYEYDNVRIRYFGQNSAKGYAYGGELRLFGDIVKDATSWISIGLLKTEEDVTNDLIAYKGVAGNDSATETPGFIPRPTDQRFMVGMYFEDYLPRNKNFKMHLNLMYSSGLPFGPPDQKRYGDTLRLPDYKRVDIGFSGLLLDGAKKERPAHSFFRNFQSIWLSLEVFNLLGIQNTLSYSWIQDQTSNKVYAVPNRLTSRLINAKLVFRF
jgi:hypothetical protein